MKYEIEQLPFEDFKKLGLEKQQVLSLPRSTMNALLSGNRTSLIGFENVTLNTGEMTRLDAKLSLEKNKDGSVRLNVHPVNEKLEKTFGLSEKDLKYLRKNDLSFIPIKIEKEGKKIDALATYDSTTNEIIAIDQKKLKAPDYINDQKLTALQKMAFVSGKPIWVGGKRYILNPHNEFGISGDNLLSVQIGHSKYRAENMGIDALAITAGLGHYVMLYHLANMMLNSRGQKVNIDRSLNNKNFRDALIASRNEIIERQDILDKTLAQDKNLRSDKLTVDEIKQVLEKRAGEHVVFDQIQTNDVIEQSGEHNEVKTSLKTDKENNGLSINEEKPKSYSLKM